MSSASADPRSRPVIAVFGATGRQGGAVFRALVSSNEFRVRAITRNPNSEAAQKLLENQNSGQVEVVAADLDNNESLQSALAGAWGAFLVIQFYDPKDPAAGARNEEKQARNTADQALKAGVKFFVYSSLADAATLSAGRHPVHHFTHKNKAEQYIRTLPFSDGSAFPYAGCYAENFLSMLAPKKNANDGVYEFANVVRNDVALPIVDIEEEFGSTVLEIFRQPKNYNGKSVFTGKYLTLPQWCETFTQVTGKASRYIQLPLEVGKSFGEEIFDMFTYFNDCGYYGGAPISTVPNAKKTDPIAFWRRYAAQF